MVLPGHLAGGYLATKILLSLTAGTISPDQTTALLIIGTLAGEAPDGDLLRFYLVHKLKLGNDQSHRDYFSHSPLVWLVISLLIVVSGSMTGSNFFQLIGWTVLAGSWSHFLLDSIEYGIRWLWPFSQKRFAIHHRPEEERSTEGAGTVSYYWRFIKNEYVKRISFYCEVVIVVVAIVVVL